MHILKFIYTTKSRAITSLRLQVGQFWYSVIQAPRHCSSKTWLHSSLVTGSPGLKVSVHRTHFAIRYWGSFVLLAFLQDCLSLCSMVKILWWVGSWRNTILKTVTRISKEWNMEYGSGYWLNRLKDESQTWYILHVLWHAQRRPLSRSWKHSL